MWEPEGGLCGGRETAFQRACSEARRFCEGDRHRGRFKKFNQVQNVSSLSELREVFDNVILWILEGMQLIDNNQHTRLHSCFELRSQCSHPGEAPITEYNLLSFFSDINEIVFKNPKLAM